MTWGRGAQAQDWYERYIGKKTQTASAHAPEGDDKPCDYNSDSRPCWGEVFEYALTSTTFQHCCEAHHDVREFGMDSYREFTVAAVGYAVIARVLGITEDEVRAREGAESEEEARARLLSPPPWHWKKNLESEELPVLLDANDEVVCNFGWETQYYPTEGSPPNAANSEMIAAAPEMFQLLQDGLKGRSGTFVKVQALIDRINSLQSKPSSSPGTSSPET
jgi:hypothetical protein